VRGRAPFDWLTGNQLDLTFVENLFLDLSQYARKFAFMMVLSVPPIEVTAPY
jgi:hypothetical protein